MPGDRRPGVAAIALVRDPTGRVLLVRQRSGPFAGSWLLPGGGVEADEAVSETAARELREETGLRATASRVVAVYRTRSEPAGSYDLTVVLHELDGNGALTSERGSDVAWFAPGDIPDPHPTLRRALLDANVRADSAAAIDAALAAAGIAMERLG